MLSYKLFYLASLVIFSFGAFTFSLLALFYWRELRSNHDRDGQGVFSSFTAVCAAAFLVNLLNQIITALDPDFPWANVLFTSLQLVNGLLPPLFVHLVYQEETGRLPIRHFWLWLLPAFYWVSLLAILVSSSGFADYMPVGRSGQLDNLPLLILGMAGVLGLLMQILSRRTLSPVERRHRNCIRALLILALAITLVNWLRPSPLVAMLPDYLVLGFFCVTLYYRERLIFFDLLIKRGAFYGLAVVVLTMFFAFGGQLFDDLTTDWKRPWIFALFLTPFWLAAPWIYGRMETLIDRLWLQRRYAAAEAERRFMEAIQLSLTEEDLRDRAARSLNEIFQTHAEVRFDLGEADCQNGAASAEMERDGTLLGMVSLKPKPGMMPYMSDDRRLLQSLAGTLTVVLENVRFREQRRRQEDRERELRLLAGRAELKALRAQINPHFLFNALNAIAGLIQDRPQLADETIEQLALVFRYTLNAAEREWVRLDEELEFARSYLRIEQARFGLRLQVAFDIDPGAGAVPVPAMSIQPLVENAIKHGVSAIEGCGKVRLRAIMNHETLSIEVYDNGPGFPVGFSLSPAGEGNPFTGHGLRNVIERLHGYYGNAAGLHWSSSPDDTRVRLTIPLVSATAAAGSGLNDAHSNRR